MIRKSLLAFCGAAIFVVALALHADTPKTETVTYKSGSDTVSGYLALPSGTGKHPAIIVIHEYWGLNDWVKDEARKFADQGYVALAVDLYRGTVATDPDTAHQLMRGLPDDRGLRDLEAAYAYLAARPDLVTMDILMEGRDGIVAIQAIRHIDPSAKIEVMLNQNAVSYIIPGVET